MNGPLASMTSTIWLLKQLSISPPNQMEETETRFMDYFNVYYQGKSYIWELTKAWQEKWYPTWVGVLTKLWKCILELFWGYWILFIVIYLFHLLVQNYFYKVQIFLSMFNIIWTQSNFLIMVKSKNLPYKFTYLSIVTNIWTHSKNIERGQKYLNMVKKYLN